MTHAFCLLAFVLYVVSFLFSFLPSQRVPDVRYISGRVSVGSLTPWPMCVDCLTSGGLCTCSWGKDFDDLNFPLHQIIVLFKLCV